jgi:hypothetical protein
VTIRGRCAGDAAAALDATLPGLGLADGEAQVEVRAVAGRERAIVQLGIRRPADPAHGAGYAAALAPAHGWAALLRPLAGGGLITLGERTDLAAELADEGWHRLAVRAQGPRLWLLLDGRPILAAFDSTFDGGGLGLALVRAGGADDEEETAVLFRNLRVSALADGDPARTPTYRRP